MHSRQNGFLFLSKNLELANSNFWRKYKNITKAALLELKPDLCGTFVPVQQKSNLVEEIFAPALIAMTDEAHELTRGVEREGARTACQFETGFFGSAVALTVITVVAAGYEIFPR